MLQSTLNLKFLTFWRMPFQEKRLFFINGCLLGCAKMAQLFLSYRQLHTYLGRSCQMLVTSTMLSGEQLQQALLIRRTIALAVRFTPWISTCLIQAMIASFWCRYYKIPYMLFIGLDKNSKPSEKNAHAWVMAGPVAITGGNALATHQVICSYSNVF